MVSEMESVNKNSATSVVNDSSYLDNSSQQLVHSPQSVGIEFVRQYYTLLNQAPHLLYRFYADDSTFTHGSLDRRCETVPHYRGQKQINAKIMSMNYKNCRTKIRQVDSMETVGNAIVIQVTGDLSNNGQPLRRFLQTFVLTPQSPNKYYVRNDIFRYQDEICFEENDESIDKVESEPKLETVPDDIDSQPNTNNSTMAEKEYLYPTNGNDASANIANVEPAISNEEEVESALDTSIEVNETELNNETKNRFDEDVDESGSISDAYTNQLSNEPKTYANMVSKSFQAMNLSSNRPLVNSNPAEVPIVVEAPAPVTLAPVSTAVTVVTTAPANPTNKTLNFPPQRENRGFSKKANFNRRNESKDNKNNDSDSAEGESHFNPGSKKYSDDHQLFIGNLLPNFTEEELHSIFQKFGKIVEVRINRQTHKMGSNNNKTNRNYGFITFENADVVDQVIAQKPIFHENHRYNVEKKQGKSSNNFERNRNNANGNSPRNSNQSNVNNAGGARHSQSNSGGGQGGNMVGQRNRSGPNYNHSSNSMNNRNFGGQNFQNRNSFSYQQNR